MVTRRPPRTLPGSEPLMVKKVVLGIFLGTAVVILALNAATAAATGTHRGQLPWPLVQWALTTPLGTLAVALVGGLVWGLPVVWAPRERIAFTYVVDVTELPLPAWPRPLPPWRRPGGSTRAAYLLGHGWRQRVLSLLALAFAGLLVLGFFAAYIAIYVYGIRQLPDCSGARCPPTYSQFPFPTILIGLAIVSLGQYWRVRQVERRCGIWFRAVGGALGDCNCSVRRPGVTAEAAAAALARSTRAVERPMARGALVVALFSVPYFLVLIALALLTVWLPTQWMPA